MQHAYSELDEFEQSRMAREAALFNLPVIKPIDIKAHQVDCAKIFGYNFDFKFCKIPQDDRRGAVEQVKDTFAEPQQKNSQQENAAGVKDGTVSASANFIEAASQLSDDND